MAQRNSRVQEWLDVLMPLVRDLIGQNEEAKEEASPRLMMEMYNILESGDHEVLNALFETLRADGLVDAWRFLWEATMSMSCEKEYTNGKHTALVGLPLLPAWRGTCTPLERKHLAKVLKDEGVLVGRAKVVWFPVPQSIHRLRDTNPVTFFRLNTPDQTAPHHWKYWVNFTPDLHVLVGRVELSGNGYLEWPNLERLRQAMVKSVGWESNSMGYMAPLMKFLDLDTGGMADPVEQMMVNMSLHIREALRSWITEDDIDVKGSRILLEELKDGRIDVYVQVKKQPKRRLS